MADERRPAEESGGDQPAPDAGDATTVVPPAEDATTALPAADEADAATVPVDAPRWAGSAPVPAPDDADLNYPEPHPPVREAAPGTWEQDEPRSRVTPAVIVLVVVVLLAMLGTGLWLIFSSSGDNSAPNPGATQPSATTQQTTATPAPTTETTPPPTTPPPTTPPPPPTTPPPAVPVQVTVPTDLVGKPEAVARQRLVAIGLVPQTSRRVAPAPPGTVIDTEPGGGSIVDKGTQVVLIVAVAPPTSPSSKGPTANASVPAP
jgi:hypothetical protein